MPLPGATAASCERDEIQADDHISTAGFRSERAGQEGGTSPEDGPNGHRTLACVTTWMETCHPYRETSHHTVDDTASVCCLFIVLQEHSVNDSGRECRFPKHFQHCLLPTQTAHALNLPTLRPSRHLDSPSPTCITPQRTTSQPYTPVSPHHFTLQLHP